MSAIEQALRRVAQQRQEGEPPLAVPHLEPMPHLTAGVGPRGAHMALGAALAVLLLTAGAGATWLWWRYAGASQAPEAVPVPAATVAAARPAPQVVPGATASAPRLAASVLPSALTARDWPKAPGRLWTAGQHQKAAQQWLDILRSESPETTALLVAERQTLGQAARLYRDWAGKVPVAVLAGASGSGATWMVLAVPVASELERARGLLKAAQGRAPAWGSLPHWLARLEPALAPPLQPVTGERAGPASAPVVTAPATATASAQAVAAPGRSAPPAPATVSAAAVNASAPQPASSGPSAASRAIDADFQAIERLLARGDHANAVEAATRLEQYAGQTWRTRYLTGVALSGLGRWDEASAALSVAQAKNPGHPLAAVYHSVALQEKGDHAQALRALALALEKNPTVPELWLNQGISLQALGQAAEATQAYQRFLELSTHRVDLQAQRAWVQGRIPKAK